MRRRRALARRPARAARLGRLCAHHIDVLAVVTALPVDLASYRQLGPVYQVIGCDRGTVRLAQTAHFLNDFAHVLAAELGVVDAVAFKDDLILVALERLADFQREAIG